MVRACRLTRRKYCAGSSLKAARFRESWTISFIVTSVWIAFGEMRASGVYDILIYCRDHRCSHLVEANADR